MDLGDCPKIHDLALRADYEQACDGKDYYYDIDAMEHLQAFINDCDRRTELAKRRLAETQEELSAEVAAKANKVHDLAEQIGKKLARAEQLGADGNVEESLKLMEEVEEIRKKKLQAEQEYRNSMPASSYQQQKLRVCEVCSAYLGIHDNDRRLADHFGGKLHLGFIKIREKLDELNKCVSDRREKMKGDRECRSGNGGSSRDRSETRPRKREHDRDEGRDRGRDRERKERSSDTKKSRSRSRSRGRRSGRRPDSRKRSRSRDRKRSHDDSKSDKSDRRRERSRSKSKDGGRRASGDRSPKRSIKVEESGRSSVEGLGERRSTDGDSHRNGGSSE